MKSQPGSYALILEVGAPFDLTAGKLGLLSGKAGYYVYCGSAFGPGGIQARTSHHRNHSQRPHWHIDYLKTVAAITEIWYTCDTVKREHDWIDILLNDHSLSIPFKGFGSSDCTCSSHLLFSKQKPLFRRFVQKAHKELSGHATISRFGNESTDSVIPVQRVARKSTPGN